MLPIHTILNRAARPFFGCSSRNDPDIGACLARQPSPAGEPVLNASRAGVIGCGRQSEIAKLLGISRQTLYDILNMRQPVTPAIAVRLGKLFGDGAGVWIRMQAAHDTWHAERELAHEIKKIPTLSAA